MFQTANDFLRLELPFYWAKLPRSTPAKNMSHNLRFDKNSGIVYIRFEGAQRVDTIFRGFSAAIDFAGSIDGIRILSDFREASLELSTLQIYSLPDTLSACRPDSSPWLHKYRHAILAIADDDFRFMVTMLNNRSQVAELFESLSAAEIWLASSGTSTGR